MAQLRLAPQRLSAKVWSFPESWRSCDSATKCVVTPGGGRSAHKGSIASGAPGAESWSSCDWRLSAKVRCHPRRGQNCAQGFHRLRRSWSRVLAQLGLSPQRISAKVRCHSRRGQKCAQGFNRLRRSWSRVLAQLGLSPQRISAKVRCHSRRGQKCAQGFNRLRRSLSRTSIIEHATSMAMMPVDSEIDYEENLRDYPGYSAMRRKH